MRTTRRPGIPRNHILLLALATGSVLLLPFLAMQLSSDVDWNAADFIVAGVLLFGTGLAFELIARKSAISNRAVLAVALVAVLLFVWVELAVGIVGTPFAGN